MRKHRCIKQVIPHKAKLKWQRK